MDRYKDSLGVPGEGVHSVRLGGVAILDVIGTFGLAWVAWAVLGGMRGSYWAWLAGTFVLGIALHRFFGVRTTVDRALFG